jgi:preprotein translocase subunit SecD
MKTTRKASFRMVTMLGMAFMVAAALLATACGGQGGGGATPSNPATTSAPASVAPSSGVPTGSAPNGPAPQSGVRLTYQVNLFGMDPAQGPAIVNAEVSILRLRLDAMGVSQFSVNSAAGNNIAVLVSRADGDNARQAVALTDVLDFAQQTYTSDPAARWAVDGQPWKLAQGTLNGKETALTSFFFQKTAKLVAGSNGQSAVQYQLTSDGVTLFTQVTTPLLQKPIGIFFGKKLITSMTLQAPITDGGTIDGLAADAADQLAKLLNIGSLPAPLILMEDTTF